MLSAWSLIGWSSFLSVTADQPARFSGRECTSLPSRDLRGLAFELMHVAGRCAADGNSPRLHRLRDFPEQLDLQQAMLERGAPHRDIVGEIELPFERPGGNAPIQIFVLGLVSLVALDGDHVLLGRHRDFVGRKAGNRERNLVAVVAEPFNVVRGIIVLAGALSGFNEVEKAVETDGRTPKGREVVSAHSQILQRAKWVRAAPDTTGARLKSPPR